MTTVFFDSDMSDAKRRERLYAGDLFIYSPTPNSVGFCKFAQKFIQQHFAGLDPELAQHEMSVKNYVDVLKVLKPKFIHHQESKDFVRGTLGDLKADLDNTYFDVPRLRSSTSDEFLTTGIAYAWHPHRDTWYSAPATQINYWMPVYGLMAENTVAFHTMYFSKIVANDSNKYNYYEWNKKYRSTAASQTSTDSRPLPAPTVDVETDSQIKIVCPVGGVVIFSGAQLHSSVPNTSGRTRFSIDFRAVNTVDIEAGIGAPTQDVKCTGSNIRDFVSARNLDGMPQRIIDLFADGTEDRGDLEYMGNAGSS
jgi:hypothetical protein